LHYKAALQSRTATWHGIELQTEAVLLNIAEQQATKNNTSREQQKQEAC